MYSLKVSQTENKQQQQNTYQFRTITTVNEQQSILRDLTRIMRHSVSVAIFNTFPKVSFLLLLVFLTYYLIDLLFCLYINARIRALLILTEHGKPRSYFLLLKLRTL